MRLLLLQQRLSSKSTLGAGAIPFPSQQLLVKILLINILTAMSVSKIESVGILLPSVHHFLYLLSKLRYKQEIRGGGGRGGGVAAKYLNTYPVKTENRKLFSPAFPPTQFLQKLTEISCCSSLYCHFVSVCSHA